MTKHPAAMRKITPRRAPIVHTKKSAQQEATLTLLNAVIEEDRGEAASVKKTETGSEGGCFVLACKYDEPRKNLDCPDHLRLDSLQALYPSFKVVGCSEYVPRNEKRRSADAEIVAQSFQSETHVSANFKRTLKDVIRDKRPKLVMLDYFWLQPGYYEERYGMNWLTSKIRELFVSHACNVMLLPVDSRGAVKRMYDGSFADRPNNVRVEYVSEADGLKHHPLVRATRYIDADLRKLGDRVTHAKGRWHDMQKLRLNQPEPFLVVYRAGLDWKKYLDDHCDLPPLAVSLPAKRQRSRFNDSPLPKPASSKSAPHESDSEDENIPLSILLQKTKNAGPSKRSRSNSPPTIPWRTLPRRSNK